MKCAIHIKKSLAGSLMAFVCNMVLVYAVYMLCRIVFVWENWGLYHDTLFENNLKDLLVGSWMFDTSAILYTNALYALLMLFPVHLKEGERWQQVAKWVYVIFNGLCVVINLCDAVYVQYTARRTTVSVFQEFSNENNLGSIFATELLRHWYLVLAGLILIAALWKLYRKPEGTHYQPQCRKGYLQYYGVHIAFFVLYIPLCVAGMRGGFTTAVRPITISNANQYVNHPIEAAAVLNTPFSIIRTIDTKPFVVPEYFKSEEELRKIYSPLHQPAVSEAKPRNVVVLIVESFGREYIGAYNEKLENGQYKGYAPFIDSLYQQSMSFDYTFANGRKSIDGMPSILSSIPMFVEPFFLTPASMNNVSGLAGELGRIGYESAFFHGAENGSMGFQAFARTTGFKQYYGRTEFNEDKRFRGDKDYDGTWAIWDEPFLQFYAMKMTEMREPFVTAVFTASSHHPYVIPEEYKDIYPEEGENPIHKCIRYTDHALQRFFDTASKQPWFKNTIFVFTSDHTNLSDHDEYLTDLGVYGSPLLFYDPSGELFPAERRHCIAQQIDIMPTILNAVGYPNPYIAFGKDLLSTSDKETWAVNYNNGIYQYVKGDYLLQFDGEHTQALYNINDDWMLTKNLKDKDQSHEASMLKELKAIIQSYMERMNKNELIYSNGSK